MSCTTTLELRYTASRSQKSAPTHSGIERRWQSMREETARHQVEPGSTPAASVSTNPEPQNRCPQSCLAAGRCKPPPPQAE
eukprot:3185457-Lingulodinium_polyedra.AAC.1